MPRSSTSETSRGVPIALRQRVVSSRSPLQMSSHALPSTFATFHASSHLASANGLPPSDAHRFEASKEPDVSGVEHEAAGSLGASDELREDEREGWSGFGSSHHNMLAERAT